MFLARTTHDKIVALYESRLDELRQAHESRLADLQAERDFYRNAWLERLGLKFPVPRPSEVMAVSPAAPVTVPDELTQRKTFKIDRSEWTFDDVRFYEDYWRTPKLKEGVPFDELEYWYFQTYGSQLPMKVFLDLAFPT